MIRINHPLWPRTFRADVGIRPYAGGRFLPRNLTRPILSGVPSTPLPVSPRREVAFPYGEGGTGKARDG